MVGACVMGGMRDRGACVGGMHGRSMHGGRACMAGGMCMVRGMCGMGHAWQERRPHEADGTHSAGMHSCLIMFPNIVSHRPPL